MKHKILRFALVVISFNLMVSCHKEIILDEEPQVVDGEGLADWTTETHSKDVSPNYDVVFNQNKVNRLDIVLSTAEFQTIQSDLADLSGSSGGGPGANFPDDKPVYVAGDVFFNGIQWYDVGVRYKGNSSLYSSFQQGIGKLPFRLKFDYYGDDIPEISNQRFYGFNDISLSSNFKDQSLMREKFAPDLFRAFGINAPQTAHFEIWVDQGDGSPIYYGLYTMVEVIFDTMLKAQFGSESGNCYKPEDEGAQFAENGFSTDDFEKKTNENTSDWSDIQAMYDALHAETRQTDLEQWKSDLEAVFDVDGFLKYLAVNNTIQNWDTYAIMPHNYYLYHDPMDDLIKWIPWDNNEAFSSTGPRSPLSFEMNEVSDEWPLISFLVDIPEYRILYDDYIEAFITDIFEPSKIELEYDKLNALISTSAQAEVSGYTFLNGNTSYTNAVSTLKSHCSSRNTEARNYLD